MIRERELQQAIVGTRNFRLPLVRGLKLLENMNLYLIAGFCCVLNIH